MKRFLVVLSLSALVFGGAVMDLSSTAAAEGACGDKGQPPCPLQGWMEKNMQPAFEAKDLKKLSGALKKAATMAPDAKWNEGDKGWKKIAEEAAKAADAGDFKAVQASCKSCHKAWRKQYRNEHRDKPIK